MLNQGPWLSSDNHFCHRRIIELCGRPFDSVERMNEVMIDRWNQTVGSGDQVIHLGDFALAAIQQIADIRRRLNGHIHLILGNHDRHGRQKYLDAGFEEVSQSRQMVIGNRQIKMQHRPPNPGDKWPAGINSVVCGHIHNHAGWWKTAIPRPRIFNCSVEVTGYRPVRLNELIEIHSRTVQNEDGVSD